jgi:excisionase family DNA binding protein
LDNGKQEFPMEDRWLSVEEIAAYLGINQDTVYKWITRKQLPAHKVGRLWRFRREEVDAWVRHNDNPGTASDSDVQ